jgi:hypothetical protein
MTSNNNQSNHCTNFTNIHNNTTTTHPSLPVLSLNGDMDNNDIDTDTHVDMTQSTTTTTTINEHSQVPVTYLMEQNNSIIDDMSLIGLLSRANSATSTSTSSSYLQSPLPVVESQTRLPPHTASSTATLPFSMTNFDNDMDVPSRIASNIISYVDNIRSSNITTTTTAHPTTHDSNYIRHQQYPNIQYPSLYFSSPSHIDRRYLSSSFSSGLDDSGMQTDINHISQNRNTISSTLSVLMDQQHRMDLLRDILDTAIMIGDQTATILSSSNQINARIPSTSTTITESSNVQDQEPNDIHENVDVVMLRDDHDPPQLSSPLYTTTTSTTIINRNIDNHDDSYHSYRYTNRNHHTTSKNNNNNHHPTIFPPRQ